MKIRNRKVILDLVPYLISPDVESPKMALGILLELPCIKNLSKYYTAKVDVYWPGWSSGCPKHFRKFTSRRSKTQRVRVKDFIQSVICMPTTTEYEQDQFYEGVLKVCYMIDKLLDPYSGEGIQRCTFRELDRKFDYPDQKIEFNDPNANYEGQSKRHERINDRYRRLRQEVLKQKMFQWDQLGDLTKLKKARKMKKYFEINGQRFYFDEFIRSNANWSISSNYDI